MTDAHGGGADGEAHADDEVHVGGDAVGDAHEVEASADALDDGGAQEVDGAEVVSACGGGCAVGRIVRDHRAVSAARDGLGPLEEVAVAGIEVVVHAGGAVLGRATTGVHGDFEVALGEVPRGSIELAFSAVIQDEQGGVVVAVLDDADVPLPPGPGVEVRARRLWTWVARPVSPGGSTSGSCA